MDENWKDPNKELPEYDKEVYYKSENGREGYAYLSKRTKDWMCRMTSDPISSRVIKWKYVH